MIKRLLFFLFITTILFFAKEDCSAQADIRIYPVHGIFLSDTVEKNSLFTKALSDNNSVTNRAYAINLFEKKFKENFENNTDNIDRLNKYKTFVSYVYIPRVSYYTVKKTSSLVDIYLPVTMTINFSNMVTGELMYSYTYTYYSKYGTTQTALNNKSALNNSITALYKSTYSDLLDKIISEAKNNFKPFEIHASVRDKWKDYYVLDVGKGDGIAPNDLLDDQNGNQLNVIYSGLKYSVAKNLLGSPEVKSVFTKYSNDSIDKLKKTKVAILNIKSSKPLSVPPEIIGQLFSNNIAENSTFSTILLQKSFYDVQNAVLQLTNIDQSIKTNRSLPDYFINLYLYGPFYVSHPTNKDYASMEQYSIKVCGNLVNKSGKILYNKCINEKNSEESVDKVKFSSEANEEILIKNALSKLATEFSANVKFKDISLPVIKKNSQNVYIEDNYNSLSSGMKVTAYKKIGRINGITEDIYIPSGFLKITGKENNVDIADDLDSFTSTISTKDIVPLSYIENTSNINEGMIFLNTDPNQQIKIDDFDNLAINAISQSIKYPVYQVPEFFNILEKFNNSIYGFTCKFSYTKPSTDYTLKPVYKIEKLDESKQGNYTVSNYSIVSGIKVYKNEAIVWKKGLQQNINISAPLGFEQTVFETEISNIIFNLLNKIASEIKIGEK